MNTFGGWSCLVVAVVLFYVANLSNSQSIDQLFEMSENAYNAEKTKPMKLPVQNSRYDFIIVGGGPAGCVLANRLSENPNWSVLLLEAGATESYVNDVPALAAALQTKSHGNWNYKTTPQKNACFGMNDNKCAVPQGKILGGSSSIGFLIYSRGCKEDYDNIAHDGNYGWSFGEVLEYFKRSEKSCLGFKNSPYHNTTGLQSVEHVKYRTSIADAFVQASKESGYDEIDYTGYSQHGTSYVESTSENGHRQSAAKAFILPILNERKNLEVITFAHVTKVLIDNNLVAYGVEFVHRGIKYTVKAKNEVILSAGTFHSPQLLMLSGIGPRDVLEPIGIEPLVELPVGKTMYEHMAHVGLVVTTNTTGATLFIDRITPEDIKNYQQGDPTTRLSTLTGVEAITFVKLPNSPPEDKRPDIEIIMATASLASDYGTFLKDGANFKDEMYTEGYKSLVGKDHFTFVILPLRPKSKGSLSLEDNNPLTPPIIDPNYFSAPEDVDVVLAGIKEALRIIEAPAMKSINATVYDKKVPGCQEHEFGTEEYWRCAIRVMCYTKHHHIGTCKMGRASDPTSVVSPELKVHGVRKLRVVDASILPRMPSAHIGANPYMIAEKAADMIRMDWQSRSSLSLSLTL